MRILTRCLCEVSTARRKKLPKSAFALPGSRRYPIMDRKHAANALARSSGKPEAPRVRAAVCKRYPSMPSCKKGKH